MYVYIYIIYTRRWKRINLAVKLNCGQQAFLTFDQEMHGRVKVSQIKFFPSFFYVDNELQQQNTDSQYRQELLHQYSQYVYSVHTSFHYKSRLAKWVGGKQKSPNSRVYVLCSNQETREIFIKTHQRLCTSRLRDNNPLDSRGYHVQGLTFKKHCVFYFRPAVPGVFR